MKKAEVVSGLQKGLDHRFTDVGFKLRKSNFEYVRKIDELHQIYRVETLKMEDWILVTPSAFVGSTTINRMFNDILGRSTKVTGPTCGFGIYNVSGHARGCYQVRSKEDLEIVPEPIWSDYVEVAEPFFGEVGSLRAIDEYLNSGSGVRPPGGSVSGACKGLIAAKLAGNPQFEQLAADYFEFWARSQSQEIAADILNVRTALEHPGEIDQA
jgi:hypothetical protein